MSHLRRAAATCLVCYWGLLFLGTHLPARSLRQVKANDKVLHLLAFCGLAWLLSAVLSGRRWQPGRIALVLAILVPYSALDEWTQSLVPGRSTSIWDWCANVSGLVLGTSGYWLATVVLGSRLVARSGSNEHPVPGSESTPAEASSEVA